MNIKYFKVFTFFGMKLNFKPYELMNICLNYTNITILIPHKYDNITIDLIGYGEWLRVQSRDNHQTNLVSFIPLMGFKNLNINL